MNDFITLRCRVSTVNASPDCHKALRSKDGMRRFLISQKLAKIRPTARARSVVQPLNLPVQISTFPIRIRSTKYSTSVHPHRTFTFVVFIYTSIVYRGERRTSGSAIILQNKFNNCSRYVSICAQQVSIEWPNKWSVSLPHQSKTFIFSLAMKLESMWVLAREKSNLLGNTW